MFKTLSIRTGLVMLLLLMGLMLLGVSVMGIVAINEGKRSLEVVNRIQGVELNSLFLADNHLFRARSAATTAARLIETGQTAEINAVMQRMEKYIAASKNEMKTFTETKTITVKGKDLADAIASSYNRYIQEGVVPMAETLKQQSPEAYYRLLQNKLTPLSLHFSDAVKEFITYAEEVSDKRLATFAEHQRFLTLLISGCGVLSLSLIATGWISLRATLMKPLESAILHLEFVAEGDLTQQIPKSGCKELRRLNAALADMQTSLENSVSRVRDASLAIDAGSRELASGNLNLAERTEESAASLEQTAASMEQLTATVKMNADNASQAHQLARSVSGSADRGSEVVSRVMEKMTEISSSARRIGDILGVIDGIAFQTNILALNASVEAARAGEQGRGFAVVASEVRILAQRSASAAKEIRALIHESQTRVDEGSQMATRAGETMGEIATEVMRVTSLMKEISNASQEQSRGIEQVNLAVTQMDEMAQQNATLVEQAAAATRSLEEQSQQLVQSMAVFSVTPL